MATQPQLQDEDPAQATPVQQKPQAPKPAAPSTGAPTLPVAGPTTQPNPSQPAQAPQTGATTDPLAFAPYQAPSVAPTATAPASPSTQPNSFDPNAPQSSALHDAVVAGGPQAAEDYWTAYFANHDLAGRGGNVYNPPPGTPYSAADEIAATKAANTPAAQNLYNSVQATDAARLAAGNAATLDAANAENYANLQGVARDLTGADPSQGSYEDVLASLLKQHNVNAPAGTATSNPAQVTLGFDTSGYVGSPGTPTDPAQLGYLQSHMGLDNGGTPIGGSNPQTGPSASTLPVSGSAGSPVSPSSGGASANLTASGLPVAGPSTAPTYTPLTPDNALTNTIISPNSGVNRFDLARNQLNDYIKNVADPAFARDARNISALSFGSGRGVSGQNRTELGNLQLAKERERNQLESNLLNPALAGTIQDTLNNAQFAAGQQQFEAGQQQTAFNQSLAIQQLMDAQNQQQFNQALQKLIAGSGGDPASLLLALAQMQYGQAGASGSAASNLAGSSANNSAQKQILDAIELMRKNQGAGSTTGNQTVEEP